MPHDITFKPTSAGSRGNPRSRIGVSLCRRRLRPASVGAVRALRRCCRPGCKNPAVATLTYVYSDSTAVVGPLATVSEPHSWDLCDQHGSRITAPKGWELVRHEGGFSSGTPDEDDLTALAEAVREAGLPRPDAGSEVRGRTEFTPVQPPTTTSPTPRTGRRGHLRVLPDPSN